MNNTIKVFIISNISFGLIGFAIGTRRKLAPTIVTQQIVTKVQEKDASTINIDRQQADNKEVVVVQKQYYPTGHVRNYKKTTTDYTSTTINASSTIHTIQTDITQTQKTQEIIIPEKNWLITGLMPVSNYKDYSNYTLQVSYRVVGPLYASFQSNIVFTHPMIGIGIQF